MNNKKKTILLYILFLTIIAFGGYNTYLIVKEYNENYITYNKLNEYVEMPSEEKENNIFVPQIDFVSLKKINSDVIGWIYLEKLNISYPIMQGNDNDFYLRHMINKEYNDAGSIYLDYRNSKNFTDSHSVIYGHNMLDGSMFSELTKYNNQKFYDENPFYYIITEEYNYKVGIISAYVTNVYDKSWQTNFYDDLEFDSWLNYTLEKSLFKSKLIPTINDKIITLSTCSYDFDNARFVLVGVLTNYS